MHVAAESLEFERAAALRDHAIERAACERFGEAIYADGEALYFQGIMSASTQIRAAIGRFRTRKRAVPTASNNITGFASGSAPGSKQIGAYEFKASSPGQITITGAFTMGNLAYSKENFILYGGAATSFSGTVPNPINFQIGQDSIIFFDCAL